LRLTNFLGRFLRTAGPPLGVTATAQSYPLFAYGAPLTYRAKKG